MKRPVSPQTKSSSNQPPIKKGRDVLTTKTFGEADNPKLSLEASDYMIKKISRFCSGRIFNNQIDRHKVAHARNKTLHYVKEMAILGGLRHDSVDNTHFNDYSEEPQTTPLDVLAKDRIDVMQRIQLESAIIATPKNKDTLSHVSRISRFTRRLKQQNANKSHNVSTSVTNETVDIESIGHPHEPPDEKVEYWRAFLAQKFKVKKIKAQEEALIEHELEEKLRRFKDLGKKDFTFDYSGKMIHVKKPQLNNKNRSAYKKPNIRINPMNERSPGRISQLKHQKSLSLSHAYSTDTRNSPSKYPLPLLSDGQLSPDMLYTKGRFAIKSTAVRKQEQNISPNYGVTLKVRNNEKKGGEDDLVKGGGEFNSRPEFNGEIRTLAAIHNKRQSLVDEKQRELKLRNRLDSSKVTTADQIKLPEKSIDSLDISLREASKSVDQKYSVRFAKGRNILPRLSPSGRKHVEKLPSFNSDILKNTYFEWQKSFQSNTSMTSVVEEGKASFIPSVSNNRHYLDKEGLIVRRSKTTKPVREILDSNKQPLAKIFTGNQGLDFEIDEEIAKGHGMRSISSLNNSLIVRKRSNALNSFGNRSGSINKSPSKLQPMAVCKLPPPPIGRVFGHGIIYSHEASQIYHNT